MSCLSTSTKAGIQAKIVRLQAQLEIVNNTLDGALEGDVLEYRFDSGEGSQRTEYRKFSELTKTVDWIESRINYYINRLNGAGLSNLNLRRKQYSYSRI